MPIGPHVVQLPRHGLRVGSSKIGEKFIVRQSTQSRRIVAHLVEVPRQIVMQRNIAVLSLMVALQSQQGGSWT